MQDTMKDNGDRARPVALGLLHVVARHARTTPALLRLGDGAEGGQTVLQRICSALSLCQRVRQVGVLVHGPAAAAEEVAREAERVQLPCVRGGDGDLLGHFARGLRSLDAPPDQIVVRVTIDTPLTCPEVIDAAIESLLTGGHDYVSTDLGSGVLPVGLDVEATRAQLLYDLDAAVKRPEDPEGLTWALYHPSCWSAYRPALRHRVHELSPGELGPALERSGRYYASFHLGLSTEEDRKVVRRAATLLDRQPEPRCLTTLLRLLDQHPEWRHKGRPVLR